MRKTGKINACFVFVVCLSILTFFPSNVFSQDSKSSMPAKSVQVSQKDTIEDFFGRYDGCSWFKQPHDRDCDISLELKDRTLILYRYIKDEEYCRFTSTICFTNWELLRLAVTGYETVSKDGQGNEFRVVIDRNGETITVNGKDNLGFRENVTGTFIRLFCSENK